MKKTILVICILLISSLMVQAEGLVSDRYMDGTGIMADWLVENIHPEMDSWPAFWDPDLTSSTMALLGVEQLRSYSKLSGESEYYDVAKRVMDFWLQHGFIRDKEYVEDWLWSYGESIGKASFTDDEFSKIAGGFSDSIRYRDGEIIRTAQVSFCSSVRKPLQAMLGFGDLYEEEIPLVKQWFSSDLENKMPASGGFPFRAYMASQSLTDPEETGYLQVSYELWGSSRQSAGMNAASVPLFITLNMEDRAKTILNWLINVMWNEEEGRFDQVYDFGQGSPLIVSEGDLGCFNSSVAATLFTAYEKFGNDTYLEIGKKTLDWVLNNEMNVVAGKESTGIYFSKPTVYGNHEILTTLAKAYKITGNNRYLSYALSLADWMLEQMEDPFAGFENNAWTVIQGMQGMQALISVMQ